MNGEIYNHIPLRKELDARGQKHQTVCDTEVMVGLVAEVGLPKALERMDGMFALAVWDDRDKSLHLARDRVGQKPLYWTQLPSGTIAFASELKGLLVLPGVARDLDMVALQQLLLFEFVPAPRSIYKGIHKLEPGTWLRADANGLSIQRWWEPPLPGERRSQFGNSREKSLVAVHTAVNQAVGRRLPEGPPALLLSGGIDSSIVAHCAAERRPDLHSFSLGFKEDSFDESGAARLVAEHLGLQHQVLHFGVEDFESTLADLAQGLCEPLADGSLLSTLRLAKAVAAKGYKVAIGGDGADEHFGGYPTYRAHQALPGSGLPGAGLLRRMGRRLFPEDGSRDLSFGTKFRRFGEGAGLAWARRNQVWMGAFLPEEIPPSPGYPFVGCGVGAGGPLGGACRPRGPRTTSDVSGPTSLLGRRRSTESGPGRNAGRLGDSRALRRSSPGLFSRQLTPASKVGPKAQQGLFERCISQGTAIQHPEPAKEGFRNPPGALAPRRSALGPGAP